MNIIHFYRDVCIVAVIACSTVLNSFAANYYWVGGSGNWSDYANHWATTSGGSTFRTQPPTMNDDVFFNANSFTASGQTVTMDVAEGECKSLNWTGVTNNPSFNSVAPKNLNVFGSLTLSPNMTCNLALIEMEASSAGNNITTSGTSLGSNSTLRLMGTGAWTLQDVLSVKEVQMYQGTLNTNGNTVNCIFSFALYGTLNKTLNMGSSTFNIEQWRTWGDNNTINAGTSTVIAQSFYGDEDNTGPYTYYNLEINDGGLIEGNSIFNRITFSTGTSAITDISIESGKTITFQQLVINASKLYPLNLHASTSGSAATFSKSSGTVNVGNIIMKDIHASGGATFNANPCDNLGNNTGWNITPFTAANYYWVGNSGNWSQLSHWATTSGGSTFHTALPSQFDIVYFNASSFSIANQTVDVDTQARCAQINFTGVTNTPTFSAPYAHPLDVYGSANFTNNIYKNIYNLNFRGTKTGNTIFSGSQGSIQNFAITDGGSWTLTSDIQCGNFSVYKGTLSTNGFDVTSSLSFNLGNYNSNVTANLGNSEIHARNFSVQDLSTTLNAGTSTIYVSGSFQGEGFNFYKVVLEGNSTVTDANNFQILEVAPGATTTFKAGKSQIIVQTLTLAGTSGQPISLASTVPGTQATFSKSSGTVNGTYLTLKDMNATGGATFNATQSVDNGNNTGWNIIPVAPRNFYWVGGSGNWSDFANHWATTSGGSTFYTEVPGVLDNVFFNANSFTAAGQTVTIDNNSVNFSDMSWTGVTNNPTLSGNGKTMNIYGSLTLSANMMINVDNFNFYSNGSETITAGSAGSPGLNSYFTFNSTGTWTLQDSLTVREIILESGTLNTNNKGVHVDFSTSFEGNGAKTLNLGTSRYFTRILQWNGINGDNLTLNGGSSNIYSTSTFSPIPGASSNYNITLNNLRFMSHTLDVGALFGALTLNTLTFDAGTTIELPSGTTVTVNQLVAAGTSGDFISISGNVNGSQAIISQASGTVNGQYLELKDISATGGATFNANNSVNLGNVSGWIFNTQSQTINFPAIADKSVDDAPFTISATASSGLPVSFSILSGPATIAGNTITLTGDSGTVQVQATQSGDITYSPAPAVSQSFKVNPLSQTITFPAIADKETNDAPFTIAATASSGLPVSFSILSGPATVSGDTITLTGTSGTVQVQATQSGSLMYAPAQTVINSFVVTNAALQNQTITFPSIPDKETTDAPFTISATASSGLTVSFTILSGPATVSGNTITLTGAAGTVEVQATQNGDATYNPASPVTNSFDVTEPVGIAGVDNEFITMYPNPVSDKLFVKSARIDEGDYIILSLTGKQLLSGRFTNNMEINVTGLASGVYLLQLKDSRNMMSRLKFIKN